MKKFLLCLMLLQVVCGAMADSSLWLPVSGREADQILVPGSPPLTIGLRNVFLNCIEFGLDLALTLEEQEALQTALMQEYLDNRAELLADLQEIAQLWKEMEQAPPSDKGLYQRIINESLLEEIAESPELKIATVLANIRRQSGEKILSGETEISRRSLQALLEMIQLGVKLRDKRVVVWSTSDRAALEAIVIKRLPELTPEGRRWLKNADIHRALLYKGWETVPTDEKETIRGLLVKIYAPAPARNAPLPVAFGEIPLPPPDVFPLPSAIPWTLK